jgi:hypothetical protein
MSTTVSSNTTTAATTVVAPVTANLTEQVDSTVAATETNTVLTGGAVKKTKKTKAKTKKTSKKDPNKVKTTGSRKEVWEGKAKKTAGGLTKDKLILNAAGKPVSKAQHEKGLKQYKALEPWRQHLNEYRKAHPEFSLKEQMKNASKTYQEMKKKGTLGKKTTKKAGGKTKKTKGKGKGKTKSKGKSKAKGKTEATA